ncbi:myeloid leukemia factor 2 isoform X1 [Procambarus clarkii]|uniref:myeloid leukemia factor 2 isoform X1 n=1 Tax=Procambarus clarkii TaxID=6728 RepID=UPI0037436B65
MRQMDQMMASVIRDPFEDDPFFGSGGSAGGGGGCVGLLAGFPALTAGPAALTAGPAALTAGPAATNALSANVLNANALVAAAAAASGRSQRPRTQHPFSALGIPFVADMVSSIDQMAQQGSCHMYSSSSVMTMTTGPDGRPQVYQATSSTRGVPGGVRETRRTINDSRTGTRKMAIGHHIGDRSHIIEREHTSRNMEERQEFINLDEEEAPQFDQEFRRRTQQAMGVGALEYRPRHRPSSSYNPRGSSVPAITSSSRYRSRSRPMLSITAGPSEDRARRRDREERGYRSHRRNEPNV